MMIFVDIVVFSMNLVRIEMFGLEWNEHNLYFRTDVELLFASDRLSFSRKKSKVANHFRCTCFLFVDTYHCFISRLISVLRCSANLTLHSPTRFMPPNQIGPIHAAISIRPTSITSTDRGGQHYRHISRSCGLASPTHYGPLAHLVVHIAGSAVAAAPGRWWWWYFRRANIVRTHC